MPWRHQFQTTGSDRLHARPVETIKRSGGKIVVELRTVGGELRLQAVENALRQAKRIGRRLHHQRRHRADDRRFRHPAIAVARQIAHHFAAAGGMPDVDRVLQVEVLGHRSQVVGVMIHVMVAADLGRAAMAAPVMRDDAKAVAEEEQHLRVPIVRRKRPAVAEHDRLPAAPILVENLDAVAGGDRRHFP